MQTKKYLAIFDMDGTLFDTGEVNYHAYKDALGFYNVNLDKSYFVTQCNGHHYTEFLPTIMGTSEHLEAVHKAKKKAYARNLNKARANVHLINLIRQIRDEYYTAIVTTASRENTLDIVRYFNCEELFDLIIAQEDISKVKPDPEGFLKAMAHFKMDAKHTVIFEDSNVGICAARATDASVMIIGQF